MVLEEDKDEGSVGSAYMGMVRMQLFRESIILGVLKRLCVRVSMNELWMDGRREASNQLS